MQMDGTIQAIFTKWNSLEQPNQQVNWPKLIIGKKRLLIIDRIRNEKYTIIRRIFDIQLFTSRQWLFTDLLLNKDAIFRVMIRDVAIHGAWSGYVHRYDPIYSLMKRNELNLFLEQFLHQPNIPWCLKKWLEDTK